MINYTCPHCSASLEFEDKHLGKSGPCKDCGKKITVPNANDSVVTDGLPKNKTLIDKYEEDYRTALNHMDNDVKDLIENGKEMKGIHLFCDQLTSIIETHESLETFYSFTTIP